VTTRGIAASLARSSALNVLLDLSPDAVLAAAASDAVAV
jgi:hypothetical protein